MKKLTLLLLSSSFLTSCFTEPTSTSPTLPFLSTDSKVESRKAKSNRLKIEKEDLELQLQKEIDKKNEKSIEEYIQRYLSDDLIQKNYKAELAKLGVVSKT